MSWVARRKIIKKKIKCCACVLFSLLHCGTGREGVWRGVRGKVREEEMTLELVIKFKGSEVQFLSFNSLFSEENSEKYSLRNHWGGGICAKKSLNLLSAPLKWFERIH